MAQHLNRLLTRKEGSSTSRRPQSEQQQDRGPCTLCDKWGTQKVRSTAEAIDGWGTAPYKEGYEAIVSNATSIIKNMIKSCSKNTEIIVMTAR